MFTAMFTKPLASILSHINIVCILPPYIFKAQFNIILPSTLKSYKWPFLFGISDKNYCLVIGILI